MRDQLIKLYVDDREKEIIVALAEQHKLSINHYLRHLLYNEARENGFYTESMLFLRVYTKRHEVY